MPVGTKPAIGGSANGFGALARLDQKGYRATPPVCRGPSAGSPPRGTVKSDGRMWRTACATHRKACRFLVECSASRAAVVPESMIGRTVIVSRFTVGQRGVFRAAGHRWSEGGIPGVPPGIPDDPPVGILSGSSVREHFRPMPRDPRDARRRPSGDAGGARGYLVKTIHHEALGAAIRTRARPGLTLARVPRPMDRLHRRDGGAGAVPRTCR